MKIALKSVGVETDFDDLLEGTTSFAVGYEDGVAPSKLIFDFGKKTKDYPNGTKLFKSNKTRILI